MIDANERRFILDKVMEIRETIGVCHVGKKERSVLKIAKELEEAVK